LTKQGTFAVMAE